MACNTPSSPLVPQINVTIGTAGHIDHGKTSLVKCLTGCDTDRLKEEKERGMSIDLGYAPCTIGDMEVGIVDVPGHENFIKTMVAGASGMDAVLLVVAADDGVMPQTREHLEILTLLGIRHGMVALTKIDRVEDESRELVRSDVAEYLTGTFLHGVPMVPVSCVTGEGFDVFYEALFALVHDIRPKSTDGVFRLPLDRAFTVQGYGTVCRASPSLARRGWTMKWSCCPRTRSAGSAASRSTAARAISSRRGSARPSTCGTSIAMRFNAAIRWPLPAISFPTIGTCANSGCYRARS